MVNGGADIQPDKNWTKVHNSILELLASTNFTARELRCLLFLLRMTYGYGCKEHAISLTEWEQGTNMRRGHISQTLQALTERKIILKTETGPRSKPVWAFNKYFEQWQPSTPLGTSFNGIPKGTSDSTHEGTSDSTHVGTLGSTPLQSTSTPIKEKRKQKKINDSATPKEPTPNGVMFERLCFILFKHVNTKNGLTDKQRGLLNSESKRLRDLGATHDDLADWYKQDWRQNWPGNQGQHPRVEQVIAGVTAWVERRNGKCSELDEQPPTPPTANGKVTGFSLAELTGGA